MCSDNEEDNSSDFCQKFCSLFLVDDLTEKFDPATAVKTQNCLDKQKRYERILEHKRSKRTVEHRRRRQRCKNIKKTLVPKVLPFAVEFCIDFAITSVMSAKEVSRLVRQLGRIRGLQKRYLGLNITLCSFGEAVAAEACKILTGFENYGWKLIRKDEFLDQLANKAVYLSPDSNLPPLLSVSNDKIYIIGGLVDETGAGPLTHNVAEMHGTEVYRLPIPEYMKKKSKGTFNVMLPLNLVVEILVEFLCTEQWGSTLTKLLPARIGYELI